MVQVRSGLFSVFLSLSLAGCGGGGGGGGGGGDDSVTPTPTTPTPTNSAPQADAGADITTFSYMHVALSAAGSGDSDGSIETYRWTQASGPTVSLSGTDQVETGFTAPAVSVRTVLTFEVAVTDDDGATDTDTVSVTVDPNVVEEVDGTADIIFPIDGSRFFGEKIGVTGSIDSQYLALGEAAVSVDAGAGAVAGEIAGDGTFTAIAVPLPDDQSLVTITAHIVFADGSVREPSVTVENMATLTRAKMALDRENAGQIYVLEDSGVSADRLFEVDLATGARNLVFHSGDEFGSAIQGANKISHDVLDNRILIADMGGLAVKAIDLTDGSVTTLSDNMTGTGPAFQSLWDMVIDSANNQALVADATARALIAVDLATGNRRIVSDNDSVGSGNTMSSPTILTLDAANSVPYIYSGASREAILAVDLATGDRTVMSTHTSPSVGTGDGFWVPRSFAHSPASNTVAVLEAYGNIKIADLTTGDRSTLSGNGQSGIELGNAQELIYDTHFDRYLANDLSENFSSGDMDAIVTVDATTGERSVVLREYFGDGPQADSPQDFAVDGETGYLVDLDPGALLQVNLATGDRVEISGPSNGSGSPISYPNAVEIDSSNGVAYVMQSSGQTVLRVDLATGYRTVVSSSSVGSGPEITSSSGMAFDAENNYLYFADQALGAVIRLDVTTFARSIVSDLDNGSGVGFTTPVGIAWDKANQRLFVSDEGTGATDSVRIFAVDVTNGDRSEIYSADLGAGVWIKGPGDLDVLPGGETLIIRGEHNRLLSLDVATGNRSVLADWQTGNGEAIDNIRSVTLSEDGRIIYITGANMEAVFAVNAATGDRVLVSK